MIKEKEGKYLQISSQEYKQCFVGYLDILGFKELIKRIHPDPLTFMLEILKRDVRMISGFGEDPTLPGKCPLIGQPVLISDGLLLYSKDESLDSFKTLSNIIATIIQKGIDSPPLLFRGAISKGDFYFDDRAGIYFGPALIDAIEFEKKQEWVGAILTPQCYEFVKAKEYGTITTSFIITGQNKTEISSPLLIEYPVPMKKKFFKCVPAHKRQKFLSLNWTIASPYDENMPPLHPNRTWLIRAFLWPGSKLNKDKKKKYENTFEFLRHCKRFEKKL